MAKSLRSKWKRKMRAVKRERYAIKELAKLKGILAKKPEVASMVQMMNPKSLKRKTADSSATHNRNDAIKMDMDTQPKKFNKDLKDEHGNYPVWLHPRKIKKLKTKNKQKKKTKKGASTW